MDCSPVKFDKRLLLIPALGLDAVAVAAVVARASALRSGVR